MKRRPTKTTESTTPVVGAERWCPRCARRHRRIKIAPPGQTLTPAITCGMLQGQDGIWRHPARHRQHKRDSLRGRP